MEWIRHFLYYYNLGLHLNFMVNHSRVCFVIKNIYNIEYLHGIRQMKEDVVDKNLMNWEQTGLKLGTKLKRDKRIAMVFWN